MSSDPSKKAEITIYSIPGSQFTAKVLVALDARQIPHYSVFVPMQLEKRKQFIPSGGTMVPELKAVVGDNPTPSIVPDSEAILHWFDDNLDTQFFPSEQASELSVRASDKIIAGAVWYYNWVDEEGYNRSMKATIAKAMLPAFLPDVVSGFIVNLVLKSTRPKYRQLAMEALSINEEKLNDRLHVRDMLLQELKSFQDLLKTDDQTYFLGSEATAPDFSVYAQVERLVGDMGDANVLPAIPEFKEETTEELARFWKWYQGMKEKHPMKFKGKRPPSAAKE